MLNENQIKLKRMFLDGLEKSGDYSKKYGVFAPVLSCYVDAILDMFPEVSEQTIKSILNVKMKVKEGFKLNFTKRGLYNENRYNFKDLAKMSTSLKIYTTIEEYGDDVEFVDGFYRKKEVPINYEELINNGVQSEISMEDRTMGVIIAIRRLESLVHELNHASCYKKTYYLQGDNLVENLKDIQDNGEELQIFHFSGGTTFSFEKIGEDKKRNIFIDHVSQLLHEGTTEYLMKRIFASPAFDSLDICGIPKGYIHYEAPPAYKQMVNVVGMTEILQDKLLSKNYFSPNITPNEIETISEIVRDIFPIISVIQAIQNLDGNQPDIEDTLSQHLTELRRWISVFLYQKNSEFAKICGEKTEAEKQEFMNYYNDFFDGDTWEREMHAGCFRIDKDVYARCMAKFKKELKESKNAILNLDKFSAKEEDSVEM